MWAPTLVCCGQYFRFATNYLPEASSQYWLLQPRCAFLHDDLNWYDSLHLYSSNSVATLSHPAGLRATADKFRSKVCQMGHLDASNVLLSHDEHLRRQPTDSQSLRRGGQATTVLSDRFNSLCNHVGIHSYSYWYAWILCFWGNL